MKLVILSPIVLRLVVSVLVVVPSAVVVVVLDGPCPGQRDTSVADLERHSMLAFPPDHVDPCVAPDQIHGRPLP